MPKNECAPHSSKQLSPSPPLLASLALEPATRVSSPGNVEMLNKALAPPGCTHLTGYPRIWQAAKALNVDFAPAVVGFERHGGRMCPTIEGVVVAEEHAAAVVARYIEDAERRNAKEIAKRKVSGFFFFKGLT